jgi:hypothetical protein
MAAIPQYTCSIELLNVPGKGYLLHPARPIERARLPWYRS